MFPRQFRLAVQGINLMEIYTNREIYTNNINEENLHITYTVNTFLPTKLYANL